MEFQIIQQYFERHTRYDQSVVLGIGDDCALINASPNTLQAISVDTSIAGVHFPVDASSFDIAYRALNVSLSDLAAMGATARWFTLALTLPELNEHWLNGFSKGLFQAANNACVQLIGGDTTCGPLSITVQVQGEVPIGKALQRSGAKANDYIYVSGYLGDAGAGLAIYQKKLSSVNHNENLLNAYLRPEPQLRLGVRLCEMEISSCIDISDGLLADLGHILSASAVGAEIDLEKIPLSKALLATIGNNHALQLALTAGDDYQLCFTSKLPPAVIGLDPCYCIGKITAQQGLQLINQPDNLQIGTLGFNHFYE